MEKTLTSAQYFLDVQKFCVGNLGLDLVPVKNQSEAAAFLVQLVSASLNRGLVRYHFSRLSRNGGNFRMSIYLSRVPV